MLTYGELSGGTFDNPLNAEEIDQLRDRVWAGIDRWWGRNFREEALIGNGFEIVRREGNPPNVCELTLDVKCTMFPMDIIDPEAEPDIDLGDEEPRRFCLAALEVSEFQPELRPIVIPLAVKTLKAEKPDAVAKLGEDNLIKALGSCTVWYNHYYYFDSDDEDHSTVHHQLSLKDRQHTPVWHEGLLDPVVPNDDEEALRERDLLEGISVENSKIFVARDNIHLLSALATLGLAVL